MTKLMNEPKTQAFDDLFVSFMLLFMINSFSKSFYNEMFMIYKFMEFPGISLRFLINILSQEE